MSLVMSLSSMPAWRAFQRALQSPPSLLRRVSRQPAEVSTSHDAVAYAVKYGSVQPEGVVAVMLPAAL